MSSPYMNNKADSLKRRGQSAHRNSVWTILEDHPRLGHAEKYPPTSLSLGYERRGLKELKTLLDKISLGFRFWQWVTPYDFSQRHHEAPQP